MEIILIRHGKPSSAVNMRLSADEFALWIESYNQSNVAEESIPPENLKQKVQNHFVVSSQLPRAIHSANLCLGKKPDLVLNKLREMDVPQINIPLRIRAYSWVALNGLLWVLGIHGQVESYRHGKKRAKSATELLLALAKQKGKIAVFGHVVTNMFIAKELLLRGWSGKYAGKSFWSTIEFTAQ